MWNLWHRSHPYRDTLATHILFQDKAINWLNLTFWIYVPNNKNAVSINRDNMIPKGLQKTDFCLMTFKGMYYLQCQKSKEFKIINSSCNIIHINQKTKKQKKPMQILKMLSLRNVQLSITQG